MTVGKLILLSKPQFYDLCMNIIVVTSWGCCVRIKQDNPYKTLSLVPGAQLAFKTCKQYYHWFPSGGNRNIAILFKILGFLVNKLAEGTAQPSDPQDTWSR